MTTHVQVVFPGAYTSGRKYTYLYDLLDPVGKGDYLIVKTPTTGYSIVKCVSVHEHKEPPRQGLKYIQGRVDKNKLRD